MEDTNKKKTKREYGRGRRKEAKSKRVKGKKAKEKKDRTDEMEKSISFKLGKVRNQNYENFKNGD